MIEYVWTCQATGHVQYEERMWRDVASWEQPATHLSSEHLKTHNQKDQVASKSAATPLVPSPPKEKKGHKRSLRHQVQNVQVEAFDASNGHTVPNSNAPQCFSDVQCGQAQYLFLSRSWSNSQCWSLPFLLRKDNVIWFSRKM